MNTRYVKTYNKSKHKNYNKSTRKRVFEIYKKDFKNFAYKL